LLSKVLVHDNNNNNQVFYSQASWDRLEIKPHEQNKKQVQSKTKTGTKQERKIRGKQKAIKKPNKKG
jgi:hypothetical protein